MKKFFLFSLLTMLCAFTAKAATHTLSLTVEDVNDCDAWAVQANGESLMFPYDVAHPYTFEEGTEVYVGGFCYDVFHTMVVTVNGKELENVGEGGAYSFFFSLDEDVVVKVAFAERYNVNFSVEGASDETDMVGVYAGTELLEYPNHNYSLDKDTQISISGVCVDENHTIVVTVNGKEIENMTDAPYSYKYIFTLTKNADIKVMFKSKYTVNFTSNADMESCYDFVAVYAGDSQIMSGTKLFEGTQIKLYAICFFGEHSISAMVNSESVELSDEFVDMMGYAKVYEFTLSSDTDIDILFTNESEIYGGTVTGIGNVDTTVAGKTVKVAKDGKIFIQKNGVQYNVAGNRIK